MAVKFIVFTAVCYLLSLVEAQGLQTVDGRIKITIGTTAGCGDTVRFVANLAEVYAVYKNYLDIEFIPWGRTTRNADRSLNCQFGVNDCWANRYHRCALNYLNGNLEKQMEFMTCEFTGNRPGFFQGNYLCANNVGIRLVDIDHCVSNPDDELDLDAERRGTILTQAINFIPSIVFNDQTDLALHTQSLTQLSSMICLALAADPTTGVTNCSL